MARTTLPPPAFPRLEPFKVACSSCCLRHLCLPTGLAPAETEQLERLVQGRRVVPRNTVLFRAGEPFEALHVVRTGFFKTSAVAEDGRDQVIGFQMAAELLGLDGISAGTHACTAVALEDSQVCVVPYARLDELSRDFDRLQQQFHRLMSREIVREQGVLLMLGAMRAEQRVVSFLMDLLRRLQARGFSSSSVVLRMSREEIGSYLGLTLETVSRTLSRLQDEGMLEIRAREVRLLKQRQLSQLMRQAA